MPLKAKVIIISLVWLTVSTFTLGQIGQGIKFAEFALVAGFVFATIATILIVKLRL